MTDKRMAWILVSVAMGIMLLGVLVVLLGVPELGAEQPSIEACLALDSNRDCRICCEDLGGVHKCCAKVCASRKRLVSHSGLP